MIDVLVILSLVSISIYVIVMLFKIGIPSSVSATYYSLDNKVWFSITMMTTSFFLMPAILEKTNELYQCLAFLFCVGMFMVGAAPNFRVGIDKWVHTIGAFMILIFSQSWVATNQPWSLMTWVGFLIYMTSYRLIKGKVDKNYLFWAEVCGYISVYSTVLCL